MRIPTRAEVDAFCGSPTTRWQRVLGVLAPALLIGAIVFVLIRWPRLPAEIPSHYNAAGEVTGYSGRGLLFLMPVIGLIGDAVIALVGRFPKSWNTGVRVTLYNRVRVYRALRDLMAELRLGLAVAFAGITVCQSLALERLSGNVIGALVLISIVPLVRYFVRLARKG